MKIKLGLARNNTSKSTKKSKKARNSKTYEAYSQSLSDKGKFAIVESYKAARTNIMFSLSSDDDKMYYIQITFCHYNRKPILVSDRKSVV